MLIILGLVIKSFISLFSLINPLSALPVFISLTEGHPKEWVQSQIRKTCISIIAICIVSYFLGSQLLMFFGISINSLKIAGGLIICISGLLLLKSKKKRKIHESLKQESQNRQDIAFTPLAMPLLAGPGCISLLIGLSSEHYNLNNNIAIIIAIALISIAIYVLFHLAPNILKIIGNSGIVALSRIMGFLVLAIGVEMITAGIKILFKI